MPIQNHLPPKYAGKPYVEPPHCLGPQAIPGRIECAYYDQGGEGVAFHDPDGVNRGSGELNQLPDHQRPHALPRHWNFRKNEALDISYVKDTADLSHPNFFTPQLNQLYVGWTQDGEWINYTVNVTRAGTFTVTCLYSCGANTIQLSVDGKPALEGHLPLDTKDYHTWNLAEIGKITFTEPGLHLLTLAYNSGNNFAYLEFEE